MKDEDTSIKQTDVLDQETSIPMNNNWKAFCKERGWDATFKALIAAVNRKSESDAEYSTHLKVVDSNFNIERLVIDSAFTGKPVLYFSLGASHIEVTQRLLCLESGIAAERLRDGMLTDEDWLKLNAAIKKLSNAPIFIDDNPNCMVNDIHEKTWKLKRSPGGLGLVIINNLELVSSKRPNRWSAYIDVLGGLSGTAKGSGIDIVLVDRMYGSMAVAS